MTDKEKIAKTLELINRLGLKHQIMTIDDVYKGLRHETLESVASTLMDVINTVYQIREALE
jgi:hypothetical protein